MRQREKKQKEVGTGKNGTREGKKKQEGEVKIKE